MGVGLGWEWCCPIEVSVAGELVALGVHALLVGNVVTALGFTATQRGLAGADSSACNHANGLGGEVAAQAVVGDEHVEGLVGITATRGPSGRLAQPASSASRGLSANSAYRITDVSDLAVLRLPVGENVESSI